ncbi:hypothetical protein AAE02nite_17370 [Adhaeribacter aerolatus]|uniref:Secretion system C-terminal sorting domain-containing protein n=2 Tax=Adhaeribacter aerolatus TaxID=670289 RepID=A0A512AWH8_9BACT|nr:hypothetical protein AAE02nite_17370 [Adhaeribacter aerolatus]
MGGSSLSNAGSDKSENARGNLGNYDFWVVKVNAAGLKEWDKTIGGNGNDRLESLQQTSDGGYILAGPSDSDANGDKSENIKGFGNFGNDDYWVVKLNAAGIKEWDKTVGGSNWDHLYSVQQTTDGGYILGGFSFSDAGGDKSENSKGLGDYWIVKLRSNGTKEWDKTIGGSNGDWLYAVEQTSDGGYILGGWSTSDASGDKSQGVNGGTDYWIVKLDASANIEWEKTIGGNGIEWLNYLQETADGGFVLVGVSGSDAGGDKTENLKGAFADYWVVKLNSNGDKEWDRTIPGYGFPTLKQTTDGGYILGGISDANASGDKTENSKGGNDYWAVKLNAAGIKEWDKTIGGNATDELNSIGQTADGGFILGGTSSSNASGDKSENSRGQSDYWVVKLRAYNTPPAGTCNLALTTKVIQAEPWYGASGPFIGAGAIDLTVIGGTAPYTYRWNAGAASQDLGLASPGLYSVTVTDAKNCTAMTTVYVGRKNSPLTLSTSHLNPSVAGGQSGSVDLSVLGGNGPYTFSWSNGATTEDLINLAAGTYTVTVTDNLGETATTSVTISAPGQPLTLTLAYQDVSTGGADDGFIDLTVNGGVGPFTYLWNAGARSQDLTRVVAGVYFVTVTDANGNTANIGVQVGTAGANQMLATKNPSLASDLFEKGITLTAYPNPATDRATISFRVVKAGAYNLDLYDIRGAKVKSIAAGKAQATQALDLELNVSNYAKGIYLLKLITDEGILTKRLIIGE